MSAKAIRVGDEIRRPFAAAGAIHRFGHLGDDDVDVISIKRTSRHSIAGSSFGQIFFAGRALYLRAHRHAVVFYDVDTRQLPQSGEVERFVEGALVDRAVAKEGESNAAGLFVPRGER